MRMKTGLFTHATHKDVVICVNIEKIDGDKALVFPTLSRDGAWKKWVPMSQLHEVA